MNERTSNRGRALPLKAGILAGLLLAVIRQAPGADLPLDEGDWTGSFLTHDETLYQMAYRVRYADDSAGMPEITMINLDLSPRADFTYALSDIEIDAGSLRFKIRRKFETKECSLELEAGSYTGSCISDAGQSDEFSQITMIPPAPDTQAEGANANTATSGD